jgi:hypothetical protein
MFKVVEGNRIIKEDLKIIHSGLFLEKMCHMQVESQIHEFIFQLGEKCLLPQTTHKLM